MKAALQTELISPEQYLADELKSPFRREYNGGYVYAMTDSRVSHSQVSGALLAALYSRLRGKPYQAFGPGMKVRLRLADHTRFYYPDAMVVNESKLGVETYLDHPSVVCEVLSHLTRRIDESEKREAYLSISSMTAYLLIETTTPRVLVHRRKEDEIVIERYEGLSAIIALPAIGIELPLADLYERIDFKAAVKESKADHPEAEF